MSAVCPKCGVAVVPGYVKCPKCQAALPKLRAPTMAAGGTSSSSGGAGGKANRPNAASLFSRVGRSWASAP